MKKILQVALVAFTILSCSQGITVSFDDPKSQAILSVYDSYMANDAAAIKSLYAEDAVVFLNSLDSIPIQENVKNLAMHHELFDDISLSFGDGENERTAFVQTSSYPTTDITLAWFIWTGTGKVSGKTYNVPTHVVYFWGEDGKVASSSLFNDSASFTEEMNIVAAAAE
tara:strand:+ start:1341 stop:1847 length:507 start_codon:yes stop_codon:yes gene_type:complete